ncbi:MAG: CehA/McbA family metallohydrolase [Deltaproteobacteria bacterium]|nr:CehA/McbA family metallohydrolase [Deltaproteobacteria bacterium]MCW5808718.1 CehA/McbA family metallohydrolase [Deltaproteobacteria bacterium]
MRAALWWTVAVSALACSSGTGTHRPAYEATPGAVAAVAVDDTPAAVVPLVPVAAVAAVAAVTPVAPVAPEVWLRGSTHVHAKPSGDSSTPISDVIAWYRTHGYDFFVLTDHNQVSEVEDGNDTRGKPAVLDEGFIVLAGIELTSNTRDCIPRGHRNRCRIHVNMIGATARPGSRLEWAERRSQARVDRYNAALVAGRALGGVAQMNHPNWAWGTDAALLVELARRGMHLVEIANAQVPTWNAGNATHPSMEALWDTALARGAVLWGVASDDAHDYGARGRAKAGGGWVAVRARREPQAIVDALAAGRFYASSGVVLEHAEVAGGELVVAVAAGETGTYTIEFVENGKIVQTVRGAGARRAVPATGYVRAVVTRQDGKKAWVQPARR